MNFSIFFRFYAVLISLLLVSCTQDTSESISNDYQSQYEAHFKETMCIQMTSRVDSYRKDPYKNTFGHQGYGSREEFIESLYSLQDRLMKMTRYGHSYPKNFEPDPKRVPFDEVIKSCPNTAEKFLQIPW